MATQCKYVPVIGAAMLLASILACGSRAPEYVLRGWTATPPARTASAPIVGGPTIVYMFPTEAQYEATVRVPQLEIRNGAGTRYPSNGKMHLSQGDQITILACKYDEAGEAWVNFYWAKQKLFGWAAVTWRGAIFLWPMPERCVR